MDAAADALAESLGAVASELLLATENAADDPNLSISPENCAWYGIYCTVVRGMAFIVLSAPLIPPTHRATSYFVAWQCSLASQLPL